MKATEAEKAWLAGIIDGEGTICVRVNRQGHIHNIFRVAMAHKPTIDKIVSITSVGKARPVLRKDVPAHYRQIWDWDTSSHRAKEILEEILPYMTKKREAELFVELMSLRGKDKRLNQRERQLELVRDISKEKLIDFKREAL